MILKDHARLGLRGQVEERIIGIFAPETFDHLHIRPLPEVHQVQELGSRCGLK